MAKLPKANVNFTDTDRVKDLVQLMVRNDLTEIELVEDKSKITLRRGVSGAAAVPHVQAVTAAGHGGGAGHPAPVAAPAVMAAQGPVEKLAAIKSPLIGTFYSAPNPESPAYVSVGTAVGPDTVVGIIEAMKVFNEIRAETTGTIAKVMVANGQSVEFDTELFLVKAV